MIGLTGILLAAVHVTVDVQNVTADVPKTLYGIGMEDVNHEIYGGLDAQRLFGESFEEPTRGGTAAGPSRMWFLTEAEAGGCTYWQTNRWHWGRASQQLVPDGGVVAIANRGLNGWGVPVRKGRKMVGSLWAWGRVDRLTVGLQDRDGTRTYAETDRALDKAADGWRKLDFALVPDATDAKAQFFVRASGAGSVWIDDAYLADEPTDAFGRLGCRADIAAAFRPMGVTFLRWGGTMANAPGYRLRNMPGTGERLPYDGFWYKWASSGFGVREFVRLAAELKVPCAFSLSADEDVADAVAFAKELTAYRIPLYVQIGNEEGLPWFKQDTPDFYRAYVEKVKRLVPPMRAVNPALKFVSAAYWRDDAPELMKIAFDGTDGLVDYWDVHVSTKSVAAARESTQELKRALGRLRAWNPQTTMRLAVFEENAHHHRHERALAHAALLAGARELGDDLLTSCPVNALQPDLQNDNGWDQGMVFFTPDKVWLQSYGWAHQMAAVNHRDRLVASTCTDTNVVVSATRDRDGTSVVLHVVNAAGEPKPLALAGLDDYRLVRATTLASDDPNLDNPARAPDRIVPTDLTAAFAANATLPPFSYTVLVYEKGAAARVLGPAVRVPGVSDWAMGVCLDGTTLYVVAGGVLSAFDVREPLQPKLLGQLPGMDNNRQVIAQDGFVYVVSRETGMRIIDARDPKNMRLRSRYDSVEFATGIDVVGKTAFLSERIYGVEVVDVSDPDNPAHVCIRKTGESQSNRYRDGYLYSGEWGGGAVEVFDAHDLKTFRPIGKLRLGGFGDGLEIDGDYLYCSTGHDAKHHRAKTVKDRHGAGRGLDIFSLADPAKPKWVSRVDFPVFTPRNEDFWTPRVANGLAFCCDSHNGLFVVDVKDPAWPKVVDRFCVPQKGKEEWPSGAISSCAIGEGCVYVTSFPGGLWILPVEGVKPPVRPKGTLPVHPDYREPYPTDTAAFHVYRPAAAGQARTVVLRGDIAYAAFGDAGLHVLRLSETGFEKLGTLPGGRRVTDCCFVGDRLVTAEGVDGFAVYELNGPMGFREMARRAASSRADRSVAFWCWPTTDDKVILTARCGPYELHDVTDFGVAHPILSFSGTCLWDKYPADGAVNGRFPVLKPYNGLGWLDFTGPKPRFGNQENARTVSFFGSQNDGICRLGANRFLYTIQQPQSSVYDYGAAAYYVLVEANGTYSRPLALPPVPAFGKGRDARFSGIPRADGNLVLMTNRSGRKAVVWDFVEPERPKVLRAYTFSGNPDLGTFFRGKAVIPAGHQGLVMEK